MKNLTLIIFFTLNISLFTIHLNSQPCLPEGITFNTQAQIDSFQINYPYCTEIEGHVVISGDNIDDLDGLNVISSIGGSLIIVGSDSLTNLTGIENLTSIMGSLHIGSASFWGAAGNATLSNLVGLNNLTMIGGDFWVVENDSLIDFTGLENLTSIGGNLAVGHDGPPIGGYGNPSLISFNGLGNLSSINGDITIINNPSLTSLSGLDNIDANSILNLTIGNNETLSYCEIQSMCDYLSSPNGIVTIVSNGPGCNSPAEIAGNCGFILPCLPYGIYYFSTQADIDNFGLYSDCTELEGNVSITGSGINDLSGLNDITKIGVSLSIQSIDELTNLSGLNNLSYIGANLRITELNSLVNLSGLESLSTLGILWIKQNPSLINLSGLSNVTTINGYFEVCENNALTSLAGIENLTTIGGNLKIRENNSLINVMGLDNVYSIGDDLNIRDNQSLTSLAGLENLVYLEGKLSIWENPSLTSLVGLQGLSSIDGELYIRDNNALTSLVGIENIEEASINMLSIFNNDSLSTCNVQSVCDFLNSPNGIINIYNNAPGCNSFYEVEEACNGVSVEEINFAEKFFILPNPCSASANLQFVIRESGLVNCELFDVSGVQIKQLINEVNQPGSYEIKIDLSDLPKGIYFCSLRTSTGIHTKKIVKL